MYTLTINQLIKMMEEVAMSMENIKYFGVGKPYDISTEEPVKHPYIWVVINSGGLIKNDNSNYFKESFVELDVYCLDILNKDEDNYNEIISDTFLYLSHYIILLASQFNNEDKNYRILNDVSFSCVYEALNENVNGWKATLNIKIPVYLSKCNAPINN